MKILLTANLVYLPSHGGANKSNRLLLEWLAKQGHTCRAVIRASGMQGSKSDDRFLEELEARAIGPIFSSSKVVIFNYRGVEVHAVRHSSELKGYLVDQL